MFIDAGRRIFTPLHAAFWQGKRVDRKQLESLRFAPGLLSQGRVMTPGVRR